VNLSSRERFYKRRKPALLESIRLPSLKSRARNRVGVMYCLVLILACMRRKKKTKIKKMAFAREQVTSPEHLILLI
jgi:hypothetical protein